MGRTFAFTYGFYGVLIYFTIDYTILDWTLEIGPFANRPYGRFLEKSNQIFRIKIETSNKKQTLQSDVRNMFMSNKNKLVNIRHRWATII